METTKHPDPREPLLLNETDLPTGGPTAQSIEVRKPRQSSKETTWCDCPPGCVGLPCCT